jgi:hypothetical protein
MQASENSGECCLVLLLFTERPPLIASGCAGIQECLHDAHGTFTLRMGYKSPVSQVAERRSPVRTLIETLPTCDKRSSSRAILSACTDYLCHFSNALTAAERLATRHRHVRIAADRCGERRKRLRLANKPRDARSAHTANGR